MTFIVQNAFDAMAPLVPISWNVCMWVYEPFKFAKLQTKMGFTDSQAIANSLWNAHEIAPGVKSNIAPQKGILCNLTNTVFFPDRMICASTWAALRCCVARISAANLLHIIDPSTWWTILSEMSLAYLVNANAHCSLHSLLPSERDNLTSTWSIFLQAAYLCDKRCNASLLQHVRSDSHCVS